MISVFIAMPYGDHNNLETRRKNTEAAMDVWHKLADLGFLPFCPHLSYFLHEYRNRSREEWLKHSMEWLVRCDCLLAVDGGSQGVNIELRRAVRMGKPCFYLMTDLSLAYGKLVEA